jgi:3-oxoadipate enol-lactonase
MGASTCGACAFRLSRDTAGSLWARSIIACNRGLHRIGPRRGHGRPCRLPWPGPVDLCGLSLGGMVALQMAIDQPNRVASIIVANSRSSFTGPENTAMVNAWIALFLQEDGPLSRLRTTWPTLVNDEFRESAQGRAALDAWAGVLATVPDFSLCHIAQGMTQFDLRGRLAAISAPALVISGEHDRLFSPDQSREISDQIAGSRCSVISGAGHLSSLDSSDQFNRLLLDFLAANFFPVS